MPPKNASWMNYASIERRYPWAERRNIVGIPHIRVCCEQCGLAIWSSAENTKALCNECVDMSVANWTQNMQPAKRRPRRPEWEDEGATWYNPSTAPYGGRY